MIKNTTAQKDYQTLFSLSKKIRILDSISQLLEWDQETYMPAKASSVRADQIESMASLSHKEKTGKKFEKTLAKLIDLQTGQIIAHGLSVEQRAALREWRRDFLHSIALPNSFVKVFARTTSESLNVWVHARKQDRFSDFAPYLEKIIAMSRKKADYLGYKAHPYDALLDYYEPGATTAVVDTLFKKLKNAIPALLAKISACKQVDDSCLHGNFSPEKQLVFGRELLAAMGYELDKGRLDLSNHPFSMAIHPTDSRITTRIHPTSIFESLSGVLHEGGHSLYEMGLVAEYYGSPLCEATSNAIHESQSRLWETRIGQSKPFWHHFLPLLKRHFKELEPVSLNQFYRAINRVSPSFIRVESDEVTYSLHVILRFELEKQLIEGSLEVGDIPEAWNHLMRNYLGLSPPTDREGCLQDIHWSIGAFGYFPTYTLGNLYAAHFFEAFEKRFPDWEKRIGKGELLFLREWLQENIHQHGRMYSAHELVKRVCDAKLTEVPYLSYLTQKYGEIYNFLQKRDIPA
jgi:carboxypeptidase Taq